MAKKCDIESPANQGQLFKPGDAASLPVKHYPKTTEMGKGKGSVSIDTPAKEGK